MWTTDMVGDTGLEPVTSAMQGQRFFGSFGRATWIACLQEGDEVLQVATIRFLHALSTCLTEMITHSSYIVLHNTMNVHLIMRETDNKNNTFSQRFRDLIITFIAYCEDS